MAAGHTQGSPMLDFSRLDRKGTLLPVAWYVSIRRVSSTLILASVVEGYFFFYFNFFTFEL